MTSMLALSMNKEEEILKKLQEHSHYLENKNSYTDRPQARRGEKMYLDDLMVEYNNKKYKKEHEERVFYEDNNKKYKKEDDKDRAPHEGDEARVCRERACKDSRKDILNEGKLSKDKVI